MRTSTLWSGRCRSPIRTCCSRRPGTSRRPRSSARLAPATFRPLPPMSPRPAAGIRPPPAAAPAPRGAPRPPAAPCAPRTAWASPPSGSSMCGVASAAPSNPIASRRGRAPAIWPRCCSPSRRPSRRATFSCASRTWISACSSAPWPLTRRRSRSRATVTRRAWRSAGTSRRRRHSSRTCARSTSTSGSRGQRSSTPSRCSSASRLRRSRSPARIKRPRSRRFR